MFSLTSGKRPRSPIDVFLFDISRETVDGIEDSVRHKRYMSEALASGLNKMSFSTSEDCVSMADQAVSACEISVVPMEAVTRPEWNPPAFISTCQGMTEALPSLSVQLDIEAPMRMQCDQNCSSEMAFVLHESARLQGSNKPPPSPNDAPAHYDLRKCTLLKSLAISNSGCNPSRPARLELGMLAAGDTQVIRTRQPNLDHRQHENTGGKPLVAKTNAHQRLERVPQAGDCCSDGGSLSRMHSEP